MHATIMHALSSWILSTCIGGVVMNYCWSSICYPRDLDGAAEVSMTWTFSQLIARPHALGREKSRSMCARASADAQLLENVRAEMGKKCWISPNTMQISVHWLPWDGHQCLHIHKRKAITPTIYTSDLLNEPLNINFKLLERADLEYIQSRDC